jgi:hypothetical protein
MFEFTATVGVASRRCSLCNTIGLLLAIWARQRRYRKGAGMRITFRCDPNLIDKLPRPLPARQALPGWLRSMPPRAFSELHGQKIRTVKQCPPFVDAMSYGFVIPLPCDVHVEDGRLDWDWDLPPLSLAEHPRSPISFHAPAQVIGTPLHDEHSVIVKFNSYWTIELEAGWSLFAMHPANRTDLPFRLLSGLVDSDRFSEVGIFFPALWTDRDFRGVLPKGTPVAQVFAVPREAATAVFASMTPEQVRQYAATTRAVLAKPGVYRKQYRARRAP